MSFSNLAVKIRNFRIVKTAVVGLTATAVDLLTLTVLIQFFEFGARAANVPALLLSVSVQFWGNRCYVFEAQAGHLWKQLAGFIAIEIGSLGLIALSFHFAVEWIPLHYIYVRLICTTCVFFLFSYPMWHLNFLPLGKKGAPDPS
ncbi:MAG: GtrA family protein [Bdellovibrionaceae bacterium]|nr:GtrA family protein [Bdellovibrionales bacterium]MCB9255067.1 GtrA family protein [Pseudobdellovibrionaceae bacterium]